MAKIGLPKGSGKRLKVREKSVKSQGILKWILSGNPDKKIMSDWQNGTTSGAWNFTTKIYLSLDTGSIKF